MRNKLINIIDRNYSYLFPLKYRFVLNSILLFFLFCLSVQTYSQNSNDVDSLRKLFDLSKADTTKLRILNEIIEQESDDTKWPEVNNEMRILAEKILSSVNSQNEKKVAKRYLAIAYNNSGYIYDKYGDLPKSIDCLSRSLKIDEELGDKHGMAASFNNIGNIYDRQGDVNKALEYYNKSLSLLLELNDKRGLANCYVNLGTFYTKPAAENIVSGEVKSKISRFQIALDFYKKSFEIQNEINDARGKAFSLNGQGYIYQKFSNIENANGNSKAGDSLLAKAKDCFEESLRIKESISDKTGIANAYLNIGSLYFDKRDFDSALKNCMRAYAMSKELGIPEIRRSAAMVLKQIFVEKKDFKMAFDFYTDEMLMKDSIINEENYRRIQKQQAKYEYEKKATADSLVHANILSLKNIEMRKQKLVISFTIAGLVLMILIAVVIFRLLRITRKHKKEIEVQKLSVDAKNILLNKQNEEITAHRDEIELQRDKIMQQHELVTQQKYEIESQRDLLIQQKHQIEEIHGELTDSITYARAIQSAVLPSTEFISKIIRDEYRSDFFILFKPRNIVSGDFYFFEKRANRLFLAAADCTGHGVPGAFMSMLGISFLNEIIASDKRYSASQILDELRYGIIRSLQQKGLDGEQKDGLDIALVVVSENSDTIQFAGANNPLWVIRENANEVEEIKPDKMPVAIFENMKPFTNNEITFQEGDTLYLASDGYQDQFGGPYGKKFMSKRLKSLLLENKSKPLCEQKEILDSIISNWMNSENVVYEQTDDITVIGLKKC